MLQDEREPRKDQPLFLNFTPDLSPQLMSKRKSKDKKQMTYRVNGVNILNRNSLDSKTAMERLKRRRENHNFVERRRRDNINNTIYEISDLMPPPYNAGSKPNKGNILRLAVEYIKDLQVENENLKAELAAVKGIPNNCSEKPTSQTAGHASYQDRGQSPSSENCARLAAEPPAQQSLQASNLINLEPKLKVEPVTPVTLSNPCSPRISPKSPTENVHLPSISSELSKDFALPSAHLHHSVATSLASFHISPTPHTNGMMATVHAPSAANGIHAFNPAAQRPTHSRQLSNGRPTVPTETATRPHFWTETPRLPSLQGSSNF